VGDQYLGQLGLFGFGFPPKGWALCNGQTLSINQNQALFSLLGTTYGGNGIQTFALPNLQGQVPVGVGTGANQVITWGERLGHEFHTLTSNEMPAHNHPVNATTATASLSSPAGNVLAKGDSALYDTSPSGPLALAAGTVTGLGGGQPHENRQPYLVINFCIALVGIFPSRN
jgi:microcystin-dependent protein